MSKLIATLVLRDQVNCKLDGLDVDTRRKIVAACKYFNPSAKYSPAFKLGRWDGSIAFATAGGATYINILETVLPIVIEAGYEIELKDERPEYDFVFPTVDEGFLSHKVWPKGHPIEGQPIMLRDYQVEAINAYLENLQSIQVISTGGGKAQPLWSKIKTPTGWTTMGEVKVGDRVTTPDGGSAPVVGIYPQGEKDYYRVTFEDGRTAEACGEHLWDIHRADWKEKKRTITTIDAKKIMASSKWPVYVQLATPLDQPDFDFFIDPYAMGAILGSGGISRYSKSSVDDETLDRDQRDELIRYGLNGTTSEHKFIPEDYIERASINQRYELLRGLIDTGGNIGANGQISFTSMSTRLAADVQRLVFSLGGTAKINSRIARSNVDGKRSYAVRIRLKNPTEMAHLSREKDQLPAKYQCADTLKLRVTSIEKIGKTECQCIMVDHPEHLYVTDNFVVTHNTITTAALSTLIEPYGRSILIVPSKSLVVQTEKDYRAVGLDVGVYYGDRKEWDHTHTICTWQSLGSFAKAGREGTNDDGLRLSDFLAGVVAVVVDEVHSAKASVLKDLLTGPMAHIPIRWGLTGTLPKQDFDKKTLEVSLGPPVAETTAKSLQDKGVLSNCQVNILQLDDSHVEYSTYESEYKYLTTDQRRIDFLGSSFATIAETGNTLILVDRIETGKMLKDILGEDAVFISGTTKMKDRSDQFDSIQVADNKIVIATYGVAAVGINIPRLFNIVLMESGKSFVRVIQSIGRGLRVAQDKDFVNIFDITSTLKFSKRHLTERKKYYKDAQYPFKVTKINYR